MKIEKYKTASGKTRWKFYHYLGVNPKTGKADQVWKRGFRTQTEARNKLLEIIRDYEDGYQLNNSKNLRFGDVIDMWLIHYKTQVKITTYTNRKRLIEIHICPYFKDYYINKIDVLMCQDIINQWYSSYSEATRLANLVSRIFKFGINQGFCRDNPMAKTIRPKNTHKKKYEAPFYEKEQLQRFLSAVKNDESVKAYTIFHLLAFTGLRYGEIFALQWQDIDFDIKVLSVKHNLIYNEEEKRHELSTLKTKSSEREIGLDDATIKILLYWRNYQRKFFIGRGINVNSPDQIVFTSDTNNYVTDAYLRRIIKRITKKYNLPHITIHGFRHTHCSLLFEAGVDMHNVKDRLGHSDIQTTMNIYAHVTKSERNKTADVFGDFMNSNFL